MNACQGPEDAREKMIYDDAKEVDGQGCGRRTRGGKMDSAACSSKQASSQMSQISQISGEARGWGGAGLCAEVVVCGTNTSSGGEGGESDFMEASGGPDSDGMEGAVGDVDEDAPRRTCSVGERCVYFVGENSAGQCLARADIALLIMGNLDVA